MLHPAAGFSVRADAHRAPVKADVLFCGRSQTGNADWRGSGEHFGAGTPLVSLWRARMSNSVGIPFLLSHRAVANGQGGGCQSETSKELAQQFHCWLSDPVGAHEMWRKELLVSSARPYAEHSTRMYRCLFGRFVKWMVSNSLNLRTVSSQGIASFLDTLGGRHGRVASNRTKRSYVAEIDRVMAFLQINGFREDNPARELMGQLKVTTPMKPRSIMFMPAQIRREYEKLVTDISPSSLSYQDIMGHTMTCLILEMGFTVKEIQKLVLRDLVLVNSDGECRFQVRAPGHRMLQPRTDMLSEVGSKWIGAWLEIRSRLVVLSPGDYRKLIGAGTFSPQVMAPHLSRVFVTLAGKSNHENSGLRLQKIAINRINDDAVHQCVKDSFASSSEVSSKLMLSPQTLRNAFGADLLNSGCAEADVARKMGLLTLDQIWALKRSSMVNDCIAI